MHDERVTLETPEHAEVHLELAGIGSRFAAGAIDSLLQAVLVLAIGLAVGHTRWALTGDASKVNMYIGIAVFSTMLIIIAYYMAFELAWGGQSPGKRMAGLVVVRDDGSPIGFQESAVRNILRIADMLPSLYTAGLVSIFATKSCKRLGDLAAGTIVIKVRDYVPREFDDAPAEGAEESPVDGAAHDRRGPTDTLIERVQAHIRNLTPREIETVTRFIERRMELEPDSRLQVAARIADSLRHKLPALPPEEAPSPEVFLEIIHAAHVGMPRA